MMRKARTCPLCIAGYQADPKLLIRQNCVSEPVEPVLQDGTGASKVQPDVALAAVHEHFATLDDNTGPFEEEARQVDRT